MTDNFLLDEFVIENFKVTHLAPLRFVVRKQIRVRDLMALGYDRFVTSTDAIPTAFATFAISRAQVTPLTRAYPAVAITDVGKSQICVWFSRGLDLAEASAGVGLAIHSVERQLGAAYVPIVLFFSFLLSHTMQQQPSQ